MREEAGSSSRASEQERERSDSLEAGKEDDNNGDDRSISKKMESDSTDKSSRPADKSSSAAGMTESERRYDEVRRQRLKDKVRKEARKSHKDRVSEFNAKLEALSEHHDLPRVGLADQCVLVFHADICFFSSRDWPGLICHSCHTIYPVAVESSIPCCHHQLSNILVLVVYFVFLSTTPNLTMRLRALLNAAVPLFATAVCAQQPQHEQHALTLSEPYSHAAAPPSSFRIASLSRTLELGGAVARAQLVYTLDGSGGALNDFVFSLDDADINGGRLSWLEASSGKTSASKRKLAVRGLGYDRGR